VTQDEILGDLHGIFGDVFDDGSIRVTRATTAADVAGWDSLTHIQLIAAIEKHFGVKFKLTEIMKFKNVGDLVDCVAKHKG
jgi:acyl carrier protein